MSRNFLTEENLNEQDLTVVRHHLEDPSLEFFLQPTWGSDRPQYREKLHAGLKQQEQVLGQVVDSSISHTYGLGGYFLTKKPQTKIGLDIEVIERIRPEIAERISFNAEEYRLAPSPHALWAAKEAAYKSLKGPQQPKVVLEIQLGEWFQLSSQYETCRLLNFQNPRKSVAKGIVITKSRYVFCFFSTQT